MNFLFLLPAALLRTYFIFIFVCFFIFIIIGSITSLPKACAPPSKEGALASAINQFKPDKVTYIPYSKNKFKVTKHDGTFIIVYPEVTRATVDNGVNGSWNIYKFIEVKRDK